MGANTGLVVANAAGGAFTITLPASPVIGAFYPITKSDTSANAVTITGTGITYTLSGFDQSVVFVNDGASWRIAATYEDQPLYVDARLYGSIGSSVDSSLAVNAAIAALPSFGGQVMLPAIRFRVDNDIVLGNGSGAAVSTKHGIQLISAAPPGDPNMEGVQPPGCSIFTNSALHDIIKIAGPVVGCGIRNIDVDGNNTGALGINPVSSLYGRFGDINVRNASGGVFSQSTQGVAGTNCMHNKWENISIYVPNVAGYSGLAFYGNFVDASTNTCYEEFDHVSLVMNGPSAGAIYGIYWQYCDNIRIRHVHMADGGTLARITGIILDYGGSGAPADNIVDTIDFGSASVVAAATLGTVAGSAVNRVFNISRTNGTPANPTLANLDWGYLVAHP
jgi:hypothetical protein